MKRTLLAVVVSLLMAASAQAAFLDAVSLNFSGGGIGDVSGAQTGPYGSANNWINIASGPYRGASGATLVGSTSNGTDLGSMTLSLYTDGWSSAGIQATAAEDNTLLKNVWNVGQMINGWGPVRADVRLDNIPTAIRTAGVEVWALASIDSSTPVWTQMYNRTAWGSNGAIYSLNGDSVDGHAWKIAALEVVATPEPTTMSLLVLGGVATLIRRRNRR